MEKEIHKKVISEDVIHEFYCDGCGKLIMSSCEYDDGWYKSPEIFNVGTALALTGNYCEECGKKRVIDVCKYAHSLGFKIGYVNNRYESWMKEGDKEVKDVNKLS